MTKPRIDGNRLLYTLLIVLVLCSYTVPILFATVIIFITTNSTATLWLNLVTIVLLLMSLKPAWKWAQPKVHHLVYALDDSQLEIIGEMSQSLTNTTTGESMAATICETIARTVRLPYVELDMSDGEVARYGSAPPQSDLTTISIKYGADQLGRFRVASRLPNMPLSRGEEWLLESLARQVGITLHASQVSEALQASREQLVLAREEERRRIRRDLHDGLGPTLASMRLQLGAIRRMLDSNRPEAENLIDELQVDVGVATADIRRLVYDLRPPMLDEFGLIEAIKNFKLGDSPLQLEVNAPEPMPPLSAALEVAVYRIASEAIHNVIKHADATRCTVDIIIKTKQLTVLIHDDGKFFKIDSKPGIGLHAMRERSAELGGTFAIKPGIEGGVCVQVTLPMGSNNG